MVINNVKGEWEYKFSSEVYLLISHDTYYLFRTGIYIISIHIIFNKNCKRVLNLLQRICFYIHEYHYKIYATFYNAASK